MFRIFLRNIKKVLPSFLPLPYIYKLKVNFIILPKHHWTQYLQKTYEPETFNKIKEIFKKNKIKNFWDIGANAGMYSVFVARKYNCKINAFEPSGKYYKFLKHNTSQFRKVNPHNFGLGSKNDKKIIILTEEPGSNYISKNNFYKDNSEFCQLKTINNLSNIEDPDLVKIDVEGYEYEILNSSIDYFKRNKTILIIEIDEKHLQRYSKNKKDIFNLLKSRNYLIKRIYNSNNYYCFLPEHAKSWIELIGLWGAGKSSTIEKLKSELKNKFVFKTTLDYFKLNKIKRLFFSMLNIVKTINFSFPIVKILFLKYLKGLVTKDEILISEIRSFFYCFSARLFLINKNINENFIWEGEFHLIPFLDLNIKQKEIIINILINLTKFDSLEFILIDISLKNAINIIEKDQLSCKNIRFTPNQFKHFKAYIVKSLKHQNEMIDILESKGVKITRFKSIKDISFQNIFP